MSTAQSVQVGGTHYKQYVIQPVKFSEWNEFTFCQGNIVKYLARYHSKDGARDIRKAIHYAQLWLELKPAPRHAPIGPGIVDRIMKEQPYISLEDFCAQDERLVAVQAILANICYLPTQDSVFLAIYQMEQLLEARAAEVAP